ncbi:MAG: Dabb family protein [Bacillota bacterium]
MVKHVVCFKLKDRKYCEEAKEVLLSMKGKVPQVRKIDVNIDMLKTPRSYDIILEVWVDSWEDLKAYQEDKYHCDTVKAYIAKIRQDGFALDYEV